MSLLVINFSKNMENEFSANSEENFHVELHAIL